MPRSLRRLKLLSTWIAAVGLWLTGSPSISSDVRPLDKDWAIPKFFRQFDGMRYSTQPCGHFESILGNEFVELVSIVQGDDGWLKLFFETYSSRISENEKKRRACR
jgi:hypothetical protein